MITCKTILCRAISMAAIISAPILPIAASCNEIEPEHDTTYVWGIENWSALQPLDQKVPVSADSASVRYVYLLNDGRSLEGLPTTWVLKNMNMVVEAVAPQNRHKIRGAGTLNDIGILDYQARQDSITLAQMGFKFGKVHYGNYR